MEGDSAEQAGGSLKRRNPGLQARASGVKTFDGVHEMNTNTVVDMRKFVEARNGEAFTTTQNVAAAFSRLHKDVLRSVESLDCSADFTERNFTLSEYIDGSGRRLPQWIMTKDGFMFLVMGFTGKKAAAIKEGYIGAFNWMAEQLGLSSKSLVAKAVSEALGAEGARTLSNVMRCRVAKLDAEHQRSATAKLASALHARFDVPRMELIPADQMDAACNFVASYAIEGEYIPVQKHMDGIRLDQFETASLYMLMSRFVTMEKHKSSMLAASRALGSSALMDFFDQLHDGHISFSVLDKRRDEIYAAYKATGCEGGYVWRAAA